MDHRLSSHSPARFGFLAAVATFFLVATAAAVAASPILAEFMADNRATLADEDGEFSDWIEIANPGPTPLDLTGYFLTDDANQPARWAFPAVQLAPGQNLLVFASGKDRRVPGARLHTNFRLDADGEYLALIAPDGQTVVDAYAPRFPRQFPDVSYGRPPTVASRDLLATARFALKIPTAAKPLEAGWASPGFAPDPAGWFTPVLGFGIGFDAGFGGAGANENLASQGTASQSTIAGGFFPGAALDGNLATFTHTTGDDNQSWWQVDLGREYELTHVTLHNRSDCCQSRLRDITVTLLGPDGTTVRWRSTLLNPENALGSPAQLDVDLFDLGIGTVTARYVRVDRTPDPDLSGSNGQGNADEDNVLTLSEVEVKGVESITFAPLIRTEVGPQMQGIGSALAARLAFDGSSIAPDAADLRLRVRYDDGFVAWLNGVEVARANASGVAPVTATTARPDAEALGFVDFPVTRNRLLPGTNVLALLGLNVSAADDDFLLDAKLESEGTFTPPPAYFERATPGAANTSDWYLGRLAAPRFSAERGFRDAPFDLVLSVPENPGATILYTLDGSVPTATHGTAYTGPIRLAATTVVRARATRTDYRPSAIETHTYLFPASTIAQPASPAGFPTRWATINADYEMDPVITRSPAFAGSMAASLAALPSVAFATDVDNLFGPSRGIYANPENGGVSWERPVSMEWIDPGSGRVFQADAGLRIQGGYFRQRNATRKHSLRVVFKDEYGPGRLHEDLFEQPGAAQEFDTFVLRAGANDGYAWDGARDTEQFLRDEFGRQLYLAMGQPASHGRFVHVYLNGLYWGVYNLVERPNEDFSSTYFGGDPSEWDAVNAGDVKSGDLDAWNRLISGAASAGTLTNYFRLQGLGPDGRRDPALPVYLDVDNYIDYMLINLWGGNWDWPNKNFWFGRRRTAESTGFKFYLWDFENTMGNNRDRSPLTMVAPRADIATEWVAAPHARLRASAEYRLRFADHVQRHLLGSGPLTPTRLVARYQTLADSFAAAVVAETARWGDDHFKPPQDFTDWQRERDWLLGTYLPRRTDVVLGQLRAAGLFPALPAPVVASAESTPGAAASVVVKTPARWLYYTLDGSDPRLPGGQPNPGAVPVEFASATPEGSTNPTLVPAGALWKFWDRGTDPGAGWPLDAYDDIGWFTGPAQLGYGDGDEATVVGSIDTDPTQSGTQHNATTYFRTTFNVPDPSAFGGLNLEATYDDAVAVYLNGREILRSDNLPAFADYRTFATADRADNAVESRTGLATTFLRAGTNLLAAEVHQRSASSSDISFGLTLVGILRTNASPAADWNSSPPVPATGSTARIRARSWNGTDWSPLTDVLRFTGQPESDADGNGRADLVDYALGTTGTGLEVQVAEAGADSPGNTTSVLRFSHSRNPAAEDVQVVIETARSPAGPWLDVASAALEGWTLLGTDPQADGTERVHYALPAPRPGDVARFFRLVVGR